MMLIAFAGRVEGLGAAPSRLTDEAQAGEEAERAIDRHEADRSHGTQRLVELASGEGVVEAGDRVRDRPPRGGVARHAPRVARRHVGQRLLPS